MRCPVFLWLLLSLASGAAQAHNRSVSYSQWQIEETTLRAQLQLPGSELNALSLNPTDPKTANVLVEKLRNGFDIESEQGACQVESADARWTGDRFALQAQWHCASSPTRLETLFLLDAIPGHLHLLQWQRGQELHGPYALTSAQPAITLTTTVISEPEFGRYVALGFEHILLGWDHLAFLFAVLLGASTPRSLAWRVTGFTLGHSLTLALAASGWIRPSATLVESFIALTIACAAAERLLHGQPRAVLHGGTLTAGLTLLGVLAGALPAPLLIAMPLLMFSNGPNSSLEGLRTALFGLFHGFGFAGVLAELNAQKAVAPGPLFGFNLGVELGQLAFVLPLWWLAGRWAALRSPLVPAVLLMLACSWYIQRIA